MDALFEEFVTYLRYERNYSEHTLASYCGSLKAFELYFKSLEESITWKTVTSDNIRSWLVYLLDNGVSPSGIAPKLSSIKAFYRFLLRRSYLKCDPAYGIASPKKGKPLPKFIREKEMDKLLDEVDFPDTYESNLELAIVTTLYLTGMRAAELINLDVASIDIPNGVINVIGKRNKQRYVPIVDELKQSLEHYLSCREEFLGSVLETETALFVDSKTKKRLTYYRLSVIVKKLLSLVTMQSKRSPHVLRHSFATSLLNHSANLQAVKELLGHESVTTTSIYTHLTFEELRKMYNHAHPRA